MTYQEGLELAKQHNLEDKYNACIADDMSIEEALNELNIGSH